MPFHAFLSVWLGHLFGFQLVWQAWKEVLTLILLILAGLYVLRDQEGRQRLRGPLPLLVAAFAAVAILATLLGRPEPRAVLAGLRYDIEPFLLLLLGLLVGTKALARRMSKLILATGVIVGIVAALQATVLPRDFMVRFGYGPTTIQPFRLVDPAIDTIRVPSTLGGPNQLGAYIILPLLLAVVLLAGRRFFPGSVGAVAGLAGLVTSHSRGAILGAVAGLISLALFLRGRVAAIVVALAVVATGVGGVLLLSRAGSDTASTLQYYVFHARADSGKLRGSTNQHLHALSAGVDRTKANPVFGTGLGTAGPASFSSSRPFIPENQYLQIAIETGVVGLGLFLAIFSYLAWRLYHARSLPLARALFGTLAAISVISLVLHAWTDSTLAFVWSIAAGTVLGAASGTGEERA